MADWRQTLTFWRCKVSGDLMRGRGRERVIEDDGEKECLWVFLCFTNIVVVTLAVSQPHVSAQLSRVSWLWADVTFVLINIPITPFCHYMVLWMQWKGCSVSLSLFLFQLVRLLNYQSYSAWPIYIYCWEHFYANYLQWKLMECVMCFNPRGHSLLRISGQISFAQMLGWVLLNGVKRGL